MQVGADHRGRWHAFTNVQGRNVALCNGVRVRVVRGYVSCRECCGRLEMDENGRYESKPKTPSMTSAA